LTELKPRVEILPHGAKYRPFIRVHRAHVHHIGFVQRSHRSKEHRSYAKRARPEDQVKLGRLALGAETTHGGGQKLIYYFAEISFFSKKSGERSSSEVFLLRRKLEIESEKGVLLLFRISWRKLVLDFLERIISRG
jgi:hypothetical protein